MPVVDNTYVHYIYFTNEGVKTICGVCNRHRCSEELEKVDCPNCNRLIKETDIMKQIEDL